MCSPKQYCIPLVLNNLKVDVVSLYYLVDFTILTTILKMMFLLDLVAKQKAFELVFLYIFTYCIPPPYFHVRLNFTLPHMTALMPSKV